MLVKCDDVHNLGHPRSPETNRHATAQPTFFDPQRHGHTHAHRYTQKVKPNQRLCWWGDSAPLYRKETVRKGGRERQRESQRVREKRELNPVTVIVILIVVVIVLDAGICIDVNEDIGIDRDIGSDAGTTDYTSKQKRNRECVLCLRE